MTKQTKIIIGIGVLAIAGFIIYKSRSTPSEITLGGQTDEHGCVTDAGYTWNEELQKCVRPWMTLDVTQ
jgi:hypothetical protein